MDSIWNWFLVTHKLQLWKYILGLQYFDTQYISGHIHLYKKLILNDPEIWSKQLIH